MRFDIKLGKAYSQIPRTPIGEIISEINGHSQRRYNAPFIAAATLGLSIYLAVIVHGLVGTVALATGLYVAWRWFQREQRDRITTLNYEFSQDIEAYYSAIQRACQNLAGSEKVWLEDRRHQVKGQGTSRENRNARYAVSFTNKPVQIKQETPPFIKTNLQVWGIDIGHIKLFFFPDFVFILQRGLYSAASYSSFNIQYETELINVQGKAPGDAQFVRVVNQSTAGAKSEVTQVRYGLVKVLSNVGLCLILHVSNNLLAEKFADNFRSGQGWLAQRRKKRSLFDSDEEMEVPADKPIRRSAYEILGVRSASSLAELKAAYHRMAKMNHPDRVEGMDPEFQELATRRIREINEAYLELRQQVSQRPVSR
jgi:DnaJ domain